MSIIIIIIVLHLLHVYHFFTIFVIELLVLIKKLINILVVFENNLSCMIYLLSIWNYLTNLIEPFQSTTSVRGQQSLKLSSQFFYSP